MFSIYGPERLFTEKRPCASYANIIRARSGVVWWRELRPPYPMPGTIIDTHTSYINYRSQASGSELVCGEETVRDVSAKYRLGVESRDLRDFKAEGPGL